MMLGSFYFKLKAKEALKGNWQTAMVVTFFSGVFMTACEIFQALKMPVYVYSNGTETSFYVEPLAQGTLLIFGLLSVLAMLLTPVLSQGCCHYFVGRLQGTELGTAGLWSRMSSFLKALWLYVRMGVQIMLWSLLLVVPGIIAAIRYSMAPYYLSEHPEMTVNEAMEASKAVMKTMKMSYFSLMLSFIGWMFLSYALQMMLMGVNEIVATMLGLFMQVWISTYTNAAVASFYLTMSSDQAMSGARREMDERMRAMGVDATMWQNPNPDRDTLDGGEDDADASEGGGGGEEK